MKHIYAFNNLYENILAIFYQNLPNVSNMYVKYCVAIADIL